MLKKLLTVWMIITLFFTLTGCSPEKNLPEEKTIKDEEIAKEVSIVNQTAQKKANVIKNSALPNFAEMYLKTAEIDVNFDPNDIFRAYKVKIEDKEILSDILTMIGQSQPVKDESKIKRMSGMATNNSLVLVAEDGSKKEIKFAFDDPSFAVGYLEIDNKKYDPGYSFFRYIEDFTEYRQFDTNIDRQVAELFKQYNWTTDYRVNTMSEILPSNLKHDAGEYPVKIYWAYNNELSQNIGLDFSEYLGKEVEVDIYRLREPLLDYMSPRMNARGIVLSYNKKIVGAYIDAGRHDCFACSLDRKNLSDITHKEWDRWLDDYVNYNDEIEIELSKMKPEDIIKQFYKAMNSHDQKMQFACLTRQNLCHYLSANMDNNLLINASFNNIYPDGEENVTSARFISLRKVSDWGNPEGTVEYAATIYLKFKKEITSNSGIQTRFILLKQESDKSGWRIDSTGTGP